MFQVINKTNGQAYTVYKVENSRFLVFDPLNNKFGYVNMDNCIIFNENIDTESSTIETDDYDSVFPKNAMFSTTSVVRENLDDLLYRISHSIIPVRVGNSITTRLLDNITDVEFVITDFDDNSIRFESRDCLNNRISITEFDRYLKAVWKFLPDAFKDYIIDTKREHFDDNGNVQKTNCKLFLPAASEIFNADKSYGDKGLYRQLDWYKNVHNRIRTLQKDGGADLYWTCSRYAGNTTDWCFVSSTGYAYYTSASHMSVGAPVCFRIRRITT